MKITKTSISGCLEITMDRYYDERGMFSPVFVYGEIPGFEVRQSNIAVSTNRIVDGKRFNVLRGIHRSPFQKLVCCPVGQIKDVCVDLRPGSPTYGSWHGSWLYGPKMMLIPAGCGHGYMNGGDRSMVVYYQDDVWVPENEEVINPLDPTLNVFWGDPVGTNFIMSSKDETAPPFKK
jgi:dTDP-4-dehydrorhamnose 3,5-epimerase